VNVADAGPGRARWEAAGRPIVPSLEIDGSAQPVLHVSQLATALGLPWRAPLPAGVLATDTVTLLRAWAAGIAGLDTEALLGPTPSRGRSLRNLTVNVHHPFELLPPAWDEGSFPWDPDRDGEREELLVGADAVRDYATGVTEHWRAFVAANGPALGARDPLVASPRGDVRFSALLDSQRWHAAYHLRQLEHVTGIRLLPPLGELALPADVF
jgi:hypothetical protein